MGDKGPIGNCRNHSYWAAVRAYDFKLNGPMGPEEEGAIQIAILEQLQGDLPASWSGSRDMRSEAVARFGLTGRAAYR